MPQQNKTTTTTQSQDSGGTINFPTGGEESKENGQKYNLSKFEYDLYHEEDDKAEKVIRVKRVPMPNKGEKWKIMVDNKVVWVLEGTKLTNKEKEFLRTADGVNFLIARCKAGIKSFNSLKNEIKKKLK
jgi:hypothetical protein